MLQVLHCHCSACASRSDVERTIEPAFQLTLPAALYWPVRCYGASNRALLTQRCLLTACRLRSYSGFVQMQMQTGGAGQVPDRVYALMPDGVVRVLVDNLIDMAIGASHRCAAPLALSQLLFVQHLHD